MMMDSLEEHQVGEVSMQPAWPLAFLCLLKVVAPRLNESDSSCKKM